ncbi:hypothetical protein BJ508DRAFT_219111, partial [Ascobolus immersus RN42]
MYSEIHTGDWWWTMQVRAGFFVIPIIFGSDETHLTNYSGDKAIWPLYISIGNLPSDIRNAPTSLGWELAALLPIPPKHAGGPQKVIDAANKDFAAGIQSALAIILKPLVKLFEDGIKVHGEMGKVYQRGFPVVCGWLADFPEYGKLLNLRKDMCPICEVKLSKLG